VVLGTPQVLEGANNCLEIWLEPVAQKVASVRKTAMCHIASTLLLSCIFICIHGNQQSPEWNIFAKVPFKKCSIGHITLLNTSETAGKFWPLTKTP
jgi:hypothetical protein